MTDVAWYRSLSLWTRSLLHRSTVERDLDDELAYHVEQETAALIEKGFAPAAARAAALRQLGNVAVTKEAVRDTWHVRIWDHARQDVVVALRAMRRTPGATAAALLTLALGIGANTVVFSIVNGVLLRPPYPDAGRLFWMQERTPRGDLSAVSASNYLDWRQSSRSFEIAAWGFGPAVTLTTADAAVPLRVVYVAPNYFDVLRVRPSIGRVFVDGEDVPGRDRVAILSQQLFVSRFNADPAIVGTSIRLRGESYEVVGVMPAEASHGDWSYTEVWLPHVIDRAAANREYRAFNTYARLREGVSQEQGEAEMRTIAARLAKAYPASNKGWSVAVMRFTDMQINPRMRQSLYLLLAAVTAVLLIACVNLANILLARSLAREREAAIRSALGGGRHRLLAQFGMESLLLSLAGGALGLLTAALTVRVVRLGLPAFASANAALPPASAVRIDGRVLLFTLGLSVATAILFGLIPARAATKIDLAGVMKNRSGAGPSTATARRLLVVAEVALAFVLLTTAGLVLDTFNRLRQVDVGFDDRHLLTASLPLDLGRVSNSAAERSQYLTRVLEQVSAIPGVQSAALTSILPMQGTGNELPCQRDRDAFADRSQRDNCFFKMVSPSYFSTLALPLLAGRSITSTDEQQGSRLAVINQTLARRFGGPQGAIGGRVLIPELMTNGRTRLGDDIAWEVVGVVADERVALVSEERSTPGVYVSLGQNPTRRPFLVMRTATDPRAFEPAVRRAVLDVNRDQPLANVRTFDDIKSAAIGVERQQSALLAAFATLSLLLAAIGIHGVLSYSVVQRTGEIGIRTAIGASAGRVMQLVLRDGLLLTVAGLVAGAVGTLLVWRLARTLIFGVTTPSPLIIVAATLALVLVACLACLVPARRAARIDPLIAMRAQ